ncbi:MAG: hypothetical protein ACTSQJ_01735 [Promethearchaeota archaeon]
MSGNAEKLNKNIEHTGYMITINKVPGIEKILDKLRMFFIQNSAEFEMLRVLGLKEGSFDPEEEVPLIEVEPEIYQKLKKLSTITGIPIKNIASAEFVSFFDSVGDIPVIFLDRHLGIENVKNPIEMLEKMDEVMNIGSKYIEVLKTKDLVKHVENWHNPLKESSDPGEKN